MNLPKKLVSVALAATMVVGMPALEALAMEESTTWGTFGRASFNNVLEVECGEAEGEVSYYSGNEQGYGAGPEAFYVENESSIYILDTVNDRINHYVRGRFAESITLTDVKAPQCFAMMPDGTLYVSDSYNGEVTLVVYSVNGAVTSYELSELEYVDVRNISVKRDGSLCLSDWYDLYFYDLDGESAEFLKKETLECVGAPEVAYSKYLGDGKDCHYEMQTTLVESSMLLGEISIAAVDENGNAMGSARVPLEEFVYRPNQYVQIGKKGSVYMMVPTETGLEIRKVALGRVSDSRLDEVMAMAEEYEVAEQMQYAVAPVSLSLTREEVLERANLITMQSWTLSAENVDIPANKDAYVDLPDYIQDIVDSGALKNGGTVKMTGIPYCWGGYDSRYTSNNYSYDNFVEAINAGYIAGNVDTSNGNQKVSGTAGLDCSGLVCAAYDISKQGTWYFDEYGTTVTKETIETMDYLVRYDYTDANGRKKSNHIILFYNWQTSDKSRMLIIEVCADEDDDYADKTLIKVTDTDFWLNNGYVMKTLW
ncbi:MAG: hypothetical protein J6J42_08710 [Lachnospiraceae bacterium]|nr:hypothetical protein [Lachnospiraceae bacterium]